MSVFLQNERKYLVNHVKADHRHFWIDSPSFAGAEASWSPDVPASFDTSSWARSAGSAHDNAAVHSNRDLPASDATDSFVNAADEQPRLSSSHPGGSSTWADGTNSFSHSPGFDGSSAGTAAAEASHDVGPSVSVNAANPANVTFTISSLAGDEHGTMTFTDSAGKQDVVNVGSNGSYSANLSNLNAGTITYLLTETDPSGHTLTIDPPIILGDGSANAPSGAAELPNLLNGYAVRPNWNVAGVDYYVGTPSGEVLKSPSSISMAGVSVNASAHIITISSSNVTLNGYDFGLNGGWQVDVVNNANNVTIENSHFQVGANDLMPIQAYYGGTINVLNNTFDGGASHGSDVNAMVFTGTGGATIEYNRFTDFPDDAIDITQNGDFVVQYNLFDSMGAGAFHTDAIQTYFSAVASLSIQYNTMYQPANMSNGGINSFARIGDQQGNVVQSPVAAYNTIIMASTNAETANVFQWQGQGGTQTLVAPQIHDNYIDPTGVMFAAISPSLQDTTGVASPTTYNNVNLLTGKPLLNGPWNNNTVSIPAAPPAPPLITGETAVNATTVKLTGTAVAGTTIDIYDQGAILGTAAVSSSGAWSYTTPQLALGAHSFTARATDSLANSSQLSNALAVTVSSSGPSTGPSSPTAPKITSFSPDTGAVGDNITGANKLDVKGTADPNSTITVYDGQTKLGTTAASSTGTWDYITAVLTDAKHSLTATATNSIGQVSVASAALAVTVDTHAPAPPTLTGGAVVNTSSIQVSGTAEANSTITVYDNGRSVGTGTAGSTGVWSVTTSALSSGAQAVTAKATDAAGNVSAASNEIDLVISPSTPPPPAIPNIVSFSPDTGIVGDHITDQNSLVLSGTAAAGSTVKVFDGKTLVGSATADASGHWSLTSPVLSDGSHSLTATDTDSSGHTSAASAAFSLTIDTHAPAAPTMAVYSQAGSAVGSATALNDLVLKGTAEPNSTIAVFDAGKQIGTAAAGSAGTWSFDTGHLAAGNHSFTSKAVDVAGNTGLASAPDAVTVTSSSPTPVAKSVVFTSASYSSWNDMAVLKGTADPFSQVKLYDGTTYIGAATVSANGTWTLAHTLPSDTLHTITAQELNSAGQVVATSSGTAMLMGSKTSVVTGTGGDDFIFSSSSTVADTFVFAPHFGHSTIEGLTTSGPGQDTIQFSKSVFDSFASVLSHASQVGQDVVISAGGDTLKLLNTKLSALNSQEFHFA